MLKIDKINSRFRARQSRRDYGVGDSDEPHRTAKWPGWRASPAATNARTVGTFSGQCPCQGSRRWNRLERSQKPRQNSGSNSCGGGGKHEKKVIWWQKFPTQMLKTLGSWKCVKKVGIMEKNWKIFVVLHSLMEEWLPTGLGNDQIGPLDNDNGDEVAGVGGVFEVLSVFIRLTESQRKKTRVSHCIVSLCWLTLAPPP